MKRSVSFIALCLAVHFSDAQLSTSHFTSILISNDTSTHVKHKTWLKPTLALGYMGMTFIAYKYIDHHFQEESQEGKTELKSAMATIANPLGVGRYNELALGATTLFSLVSKNKELQKTAIIWAGSLITNDFFTTQLKNTFQRHRPSSGDPYNMFDWRNGPRVNNSFPSQHTSNAFTTATVFATLYKNKKWVPPLAYGLATLTGLSRIYNNAHWSSDVMVGAAVGFLSAKLVLKTYSVAKKKLTILPGRNNKYTYIDIVYQW